MRTSRVSAVTSSLYRSSKRFVHADGLFFDVMNDGMQGQHRDPREQFNQQKSKKKQSLPKAKKLMNTKTKLVVKGMQFDAESATTLNQLIECSTKVNTMNKLRRRINTYRTSI